MNQRGTGNHEAPLKDRLASQPKLDEPLDALSGRVDDLLCEYTEKK